MKRYFIPMVIFCGLVITRPLAMSAPIIEQPPTREVRMEQVFAEKANLMEAIFKAESGFNEKAVGYNCRYPVVGKDGVTRMKSMACKVQDRHLAWSVDCGIAQINHKGKYCPVESLTFEYSIAKAKYILDTQGLNAWMVYQSGAYKKYM